MEKWHVGQGNGEGFIFADNGRMRLEVGGTTLYPICKIFDFEGEGKDHATLIARAPEMAEELDRLKAENEQLREALQNLMTMIENGITAETLLETRGGTYDAAKSALAGKGE